MLSSRSSERLPSLASREQDIFAYMEDHPQALPPLLHLNEEELRQVYVERSFEAVTNQLLHAGVGSERGRIIESFLEAIATALEVLEDQAETRLGHSAEELQEMTISLNQLTDHLLHHSHNLA
ncbi:hypothetical protein KBA73_00600 [Patescibacteria group bacterium]|nr:hypothetical protein [Patescibacteria group bacterium]